MEGTKVSDQRGDIYERPDPSWKLTPEQEAIWYALQQKVSDWTEEATQEPEEVGHG